MASLIQPPGHGATGLNKQCCERQFGRVFGQDCYINAAQVDAIEWSWGLPKGGFDLDGEGNAMFVPRLSLQTYRDKKWILLPEESVVNQYFFDRRQVLVRKGDAFPVIQAPTFTYTIVFVGDVGDITDAQDTVGTSGGQNPQESIPNGTVSVMSDIDPKFSILHIGSVLQSYPTMAVGANLFIMFPVLKKILFLYARWLAPRPGGPECSLTIYSINEFIATKAHPMTEESLKTHAEAYLWDSESNIYHNGSIRIWARRASESESGASFFL